MVFFSSVVGALSFEGISNILFLFDLGWVCGVVSVSILSRTRGRRPSAIGAWFWRASLFTDFSSVLGTLSFVGKGHGPSESGLGLALGRPHLQESNHFWNDTRSSPVSILWEALRGQFWLQEPLICHFKQLLFGIGLSLLWKFFQVMFWRFMSQAEFWLPLTTTGP